VSDSSADPTRSHRHPARSDDAVMATPGEDVGVSQRFKFDQYDDGQIYVTENGRQMLHAEINGPMDVTVQVAVTGKVEIDKLYGPLIFWPIRVSLDRDSCEWIIERQFGPVGEWREMTRIPGQLDEDFSDTNPADR
jgi:hypothetical protein